MNLQLQWKMLHELKATFIAPSQQIVKN